MFIAKQNKCFGIKNVIGKRFQHAVLKTAQEAAYENEIFLDNRSPGERESINPSWIPKNGGTASFRIEKIDSKDFELFGSFYNHLFVKTGSMWKSINTKYEDTEKMSYDALSIAIKKPATYAVFNNENNQLIGFQINRIHTPDEFSQMFDGKLFEKNPKFEYKSDYSEEVANGPYNPIANKITVLLNECLKETGKFLPSDLKNLGYLKASGILPDYNGCSILSYLLNQTLIDFEKYNCNYFIGYALAENSFKIAKRIGMKEVFCFPYSEFKVDGKPVFNDLCDGASGVRVMLGNTENSRNILNGGKTVSPPLQQQLHQQQQHHQLRANL